MIGRGLVTLSVLSAVAMFVLWFLAAYKVGPWEGHATAGCICLAVAFVSGFLAVLELELEDDWEDDE